MASVGYVKSLLQGLPSDERRILTQVFEFILRNLRIGRPDNLTASENLQAYFFDATTPAVANTEFSIEHGLSAVPYLLVPVLPMSAGKQLVPLVVTRAPDSNRIYLRSSTAGAAITVMLEIGAGG